jgi:hypothetical protein
VLQVMTHIPLLPQKAVPLRGVGQLALARHWTQLALKQKGVEPPQGTLQPPQLLGSLLVFTQVAPDDPVQGT